MADIDAVQFDLSGTLLRLEEDESWFAGMMLDSDEADGGARVQGCDFALVDPLPTWERTDGLVAALEPYGL